MQHAQRMQLAGPPGPGENPLHAGGSGENGREDAIALKTLPGHVQSALSAFDPNRDGVVSVSELMGAAQAMQTMNKENRMMRRLSVTFGVMFFVFMWALFGLTYWVIELTKDVTVNHHDPVLRTSEDGQPVITENPHSYVALSDLPSLPRSALDNLGFISFFTPATGIAHRYKTAGFRFHEHEQGGLEVFFDLDGHSLIIGAEAMEFVVKANGLVHRYDVASANEEETNAARRLLLEEMIVSDPSSRILDRCRTDGSACLHTKEEIRRLHLLTVREVAVDAGMGGGRMLATVTEDDVTYAELDIDSETYAGYQSALETIDEVAAGYINDTEIDTTFVVSYTLYELCSNYNLEHCGDAVPDRADTGASANTAPYLGLSAEDGVWYFQDEIQYEEDSNIIRVSIRFAHDPLRASRRHVLMMSKTDPDMYFQYDEITHDDEYQNTRRVDMMNCFTAPTNETEVDAAVSADEVDDDDGDDDARRRRLAEITHARIHRHLRSKIRGFGTIRITEREPTEADRRLFEDDWYEDDDGEELEDDWFSTNQHLNVSQYNGTEEPVFFDIEMSSEEADSSQTPAVMSCDNASAAGDILGDEYNETLWNEKIGNSSINFKTDVNETAMDDLTSVLKSFFGDTVLDTVNGTISWPDADTCVIVHGFEEDIRPREDLDQEVNQGIYAGSANSTRRLGTAEEPITKTGRARKRQLDELVRTMEAFKAMPRDEDGLPRRRTPKREARSRELATAWSTSFFGMSGAEKKKWRKGVTDWVAGYGKATAYQFRLDNIDAGLDFVDSLDYSAESDALNPSSECNLLLSQGLKMDQNVEFYVQGAMDVVIDSMTYILDQITFAGNIEFALDRIVDVFRVLDPIFGLLGMLPPPFGAVFVAARKTFAYANRFTAIPASRNMEKFMQRLANYEVEDKAYTTREIAALMGLSIASMKVAMIEDGLGLVTADAICSTDVTRAKCSLAAAALQPINNALIGQQDRIASWASQVDKFFDYSSKLDDLRNDDTWSTAVAFFDTVYAGLNPLIAVLYSSLSVTIPVFEGRSKRVCANVRYPCGVNWCRHTFHCGYRWRKRKWRKKYCTIKRPCGTRWCSKRVCTTIHYVVIVMRTYRFSVIDILNGAMSLFSALTDALFSALNSMLSSIGLPELDFALPGMPGELDFRVLRDVGNFNFGGGIADHETFYEIPDFGIGDWNRCDA